MVSALVKKSWGDLSKKKARAILTVLSIALGVGGMGLFAVSPQLTGMIMDDLESSNLHNLRLRFDDLDLNETNLEALSNLDNVKEMEARAHFYTKMYMGERRADALFIGVDDLSDQHVNLIFKESGDAPGNMEVYTSKSNKNLGLYGGNSDDHIRVITATGSEARLKVTGEAYCTIFSSGASTFYTTVDTVRALSNRTGYNVLLFTLDRTDEASMEGTIEDVRQYLEANTAFVAFSDLPDTRQNGTWGGEENIGQLMSFFYVLTLLTLLCSVFLISNTMNTIISEQKKEIAQLKAIGATKLQVFRTFLVTSSILGAIGAAFGALIGCVVSNMFINVIATQSGYNMTVLMPYIPTVALSILAGIGITVLASLPALIKAARLNVREGLNGHGIIDTFGTGRGDKALMRAKGVPRTVQMGMRNLARKKGRSTATTLQVALAVGTLVAVMCIGHSISTVVEEEYDYLKYDIIATGYGDGGKPLSEDVSLDMTHIEGVAKVEPFLMSMAMMDETEVVVYAYGGLADAYAHGKTIYKGRWFNQEEVSQNASVAVVAKNMAQEMDIKVGDAIEADLATGPHTFKVVGLDEGQFNNGHAIYLPLSTLQDALLVNETVTGFFVKTSSSDHKVIDRTSTKIEDELFYKGYVMDISILYVMEQMNQEANQVIIDIMIGVGSLVVLITMIGLMSTLTMNVIERTKEIGMLRCIGARANQIRAVFGTEGLLMSTIGWTVGIPMGYLIGRYIIGAIHRTMGLEIPFLFPAKFVVISLAVTLLITLLVIQGPLLRAVRFKPGDALRYQ